MFFKTVGVNERDQWLNLLLKMSGTGPLLQKTIENLQPEMVNLKQRIWPAVQRMKYMDENFRQIQQTMNEEQKHEMNLDGYTFLENNQINSVVNKLGKILFAQCPYGSIHK